MSQPPDGKTQDAGPEDTGLAYPAKYFRGRICQSKSRGAIAELTARDLQDRWLDVDTFKGLPVDNETAAYQDATPADVRRVAERLAKNPVVTVWFTTPVGTAHGQLNGNRKDRK